MPKHDRAWHENDIRDELVELESARTLIERWSELSDIVYTYTRARWSGHNTIRFPLSHTAFFVGALYMFPKYTLRWSFFRLLGILTKSNQKITAVRNPSRPQKLIDIAVQYNIPTEQFVAKAQALLRFWPLLP